MLQLDRALASPMDVFDEPSEILFEDQMTLEQRIQALEQWRHDLLELQVATDENMGARDDAGEQLAAVEEALRGLDVEPAAAPTRHGG